MRRRLRRSVDVDVEHLHQVTLVRRDTRMQIADVIRSGGRSIIDFQMSHSFTSESASHHRGQCAVCNVP